MVPELVADSSRRLRRFGGPSVTISGALPLELVPLSAGPMVSSSPTLLNAAARFVLMLSRSGAEVSVAIAAAAACSQSLSVGELGVCIARMQCPRLSISSQDAWCGY